MENTILWCLAIRPEGDSPHEQSPAESKELAERALARYKAMTLAEGNQFIIENFEDYVQVQQWEGTPEQHKENMLINDAWFNEPMYQCQNIEQGEKVFKYGEIVHCYNGEKELITKDFSEAKKFYGVEDLEPPKYCDQCYDGNSDTVFPYYGRAPHGDDRTLPANFSPDVGDAACGVYTHCLNCGAGDGETPKTAQLDQSLDAFEKAWQENRHTWESTKNLAKAMFYAGQASAVPEGFVLVPEDQAKDTERLNFLLGGNRYIRTVVQRDIQNEDYEKIGEHYLFTEVYWIVGWDYHENTSSDTERGAIDKAIIEEQQNKKLQENAQGGRHE